MKRLYPYIVVRRNKATGRVWATRHLKQRAAIKAALATPGNIEIEALQRNVFTDPRRCEMPLWAGCFKYHPAEAWLALAVW